MLVQLKSFLLFQLRSNNGCFTMRDLKVKHNSDRNKDVAKQKFGKCLLKLCAFLSGPSSEKQQQHEITKICMVSEQKLQQQII